MFKSACIVKMKLPEGMETVGIRVPGTVPGLGVSPAVCRLAKGNDLTGYVSNDDHGVLIRTTGERTSMAGFFSCFENEAAPPAIVYPGREACPLDAAATFEKALKLRAAFLAGKLVPMPLPVRPFALRAGHKRLICVSGIQQGRAIHARQ